MGKRDRESNCPRGGGCQRGGGGGVHWGPDRRHVYHTSFSSDDSTSDSDQDFGHKLPKKIKKHFKKHVKHWHKFRGGFGHHWPPHPWAMAGGVGHHMTTDGTPPVDVPKTMCTLCWHRIKPLTLTEVLECGHIYHRLCLKELFELAMKSSSEPLEVFCSHCKDKIDDNLMNELRVRFADFGSTSTATDGATSRATTSGRRDHTRRDSSSGGGQLMVVDLLEN